MNFYAPFATKSSRNCRSLTTICRAKSINKLQKNSRLQVECLMRNSNQTWQLKDSVWRKRQNKLTKLLTAVMKSPKKNRKRAKKRKIKTKISKRKQTLTTQMSGCIKRQTKEEHLKSTGETGSPGKKILRKTMMTGRMRKNLKIKRRKIIIKSK